ncbi:MAG: hypothetical protein AABX98_00485, partial [Nanoarchaeota archaeon]
MVQGLLEKLLRETTDKDQGSASNRIFDLQDIRLEENEDNRREGISIRAEYHSPCGIDRLEATLEKPNHIFDPEVVEALAHEFVGERIKDIRIYAHPEWKASDYNSCFDLRIGQKVQSLTWCDIGNKQQRWIQEHEAFVREILAIFGGALRWNEGIIIPDDSETKITPEKI